MAFGYVPARLPPGGGVRLPSQQPTPAPAPTAPGSQISPWATGAGVLSAGIGLLGSGLEARQALENANAAQASNEYNAALAELEGTYEAYRIWRAGRRQLSSQYVQMAGKSGVVGDEGSWLEVVASNAGAYETEAVNAIIRSRNTARLDRMRGETARREGGRKATASLLSGTARAAGAIARLI